jgi:hypothetical protein
VDWYQRRYVRINSLTGSVGFWLVLIDPLICAVLGLFSGIMVLVALVTLWIPETKNVSIAQIEKGILYGEAVGSDSDEATPSEAESRDTRRQAGSGGLQSGDRSCVSHHAELRYGGVRGFLWERHVLLTRSMIFRSKVLERVTAMLQ